MTNLETRLGILEQKLLCNEEDMLDCLVIVPESGRRNAVSDESEIIRLTTNDKIYDRKSGESEETFVSRVAESAKATLPLPSAVPCLLAVTEKMESERTRADLRAL